jgi:hypothetical protein
MIMWRDGFLMFQLWVFSRQNGEAYQKNGSGAAQAAEEAIMSYTQIIYA